MTRHTPNGSIMDRHGPIIIHLMTSMDTVACGSRVTYDTAGTSLKKNVTCCKCKEVIGK